MQNNAFTPDAVLANLNIKSLNAMQEAAIAASREHRELILLSATGSGKTLAFLLPLLEQFDPANKLTTQAMIVVPSRELALQIEKVFKQMGTGFKVTCCYGGHLRETEENNLIQPPALLVGTPGRIADHIRRGNITTQTITALVLDEFDKSLEQGFQEEMAFIIQSLPALNRRMLTSATEAVPVPAFVGLQEPETLNFLSPDGKNSPDMLDIKRVLSPEKDKSETLFRLICYLGNRSTIIFCNHRETVEQTSDMLSAKGINNEFYHGAMEQRDRDAALCKFRNGSTNILVTTDLAARGLDIPHIRYIIHFHLPATQEIFTHRNGRTARMEASGTAILMIGPEEYLPPYIDPAEAPLIELPEQYEIPEKPIWATLYISLGKKDKVNKIDIVGFLAAKGELRKEDIGLIEVKDFFSFVAIRKARMSHVLHLIKNEKIKNKKAKFEIAK